MAGEYTVKILSSEEFNKLPFKRIQNNPDAVFGAADKKNRIAYVRDTGYNDITKANIGHELDELMQDVSPHEEDGIRYKDFSQSFGNFMGKIPVVGKLTGGLGKAVGGGIDMLGAGASKLGLPNFNIGNPSVSQFGDQVRAAKQASAPSMSGSIWKGINSGSADSVARNGATPSKSNWFGNMVGGIGDMFKGGGDNNTGYDYVGGGGGGKGSVGGFNLGQAALGSGVSMLGNLFAPKVKAPDFSGIRSDLEGKIAGEDGIGSEPYNLGMTEARRQLGTEPGTLPDAVLANLYQNRDDEIEALEDRFRGNQQGGGISESDTSRMGILRTEIVKKYEELEQQMQHEYQQTQEARHMETMNTMLNLDQAQYNQYAALAQLDVAEIVEQYAVDIRTATDFKTLFGNIGGTILNNAFPQRA